MTMKELRPDLYRENAFRITGLPVRATTRDIRRHADKLRLMESIGRSGASEGVLPPAQPPDEDARRRAAQRLRDPVSRLVDELFWLWPMAEGETDAAMAALLKGEPQDALRVWERTTKQPAKAVAVHNIAVLSHFWALDADELDENAGRLWKRAYKCWGEVIADDFFWDLMRARAKELDDPRLTGGTVRRMREDLPAALLAINAQLAASAARDGRLKDSRGHISGMSASGFASELVDEARRGAVEHETSRIKALCENAWQAVKADPERGDELAERLLDEAKPLLRVVTGVLSDDHRAVREAGDDLALAVLGCVVAYVNSAEGYQRSLDLLEPALALANTESVRDRVQKNIKIITDNLAYASCFFCGQDADEACARKLPMHGDINRETTAYYQTRITWRTITVEVPRCRRCRRKRGWRIAGSVLLGPLVAVMAVAFLAEAVALGAILMAVAIFMMIWLIVGSQRDPTDFGPVLKLFAEGWQRGDRPPEARR
ncbi:hypothetical protein ABZ897_15325 [Nonomuraea sp. NPDC046802]|uniref:hypothetical protein n=1 Tax=Nonomuraea sp. NPDC046802 TaxID=3154919 RepID=UPI003407E85C